MNLEILKTQLPQAPIAQLANLCIRDWKKPSPHATPYLSAMLTLGDMSGSYGADSAKEIVLYFLSNAAGWRGEIARLVKAELKRRCELA